VSYEQVQILDLGKERAPGSSHSNSLFQRFLNFKNFTVNFKEFFANKGVAPLDLHLIRGGPPGSAPDKIQLMNTLSGRP
jgi:hypothetical protein